jgi:beta-lactam-binding protein with PASTA domain
MTILERLRWLGKVVLLVFLLASVAFLSAVTAMRFAIEGREVVIPDLTGKRLLDAESQLSDRGLGMRIEDRVFSPQPVDAVVRQSPQAGIRVKTGQRVHVVLSLGQQRVTIPAIENDSSRTARIELLRSGLQIGEISSTHFPDFPADAVMAQNPAPGSTGASSPHVDVLISLGEKDKEWVMPSYIGLPLGEAERRITEAGFRLDKVGQQAPTLAPAAPAASPAAGGASGTPAVVPPVTGEQTPATAPAPPATTSAVVAQEPPPGARIAADDPVQLVVSP